MTTDSDPVVGNWYQHLGKGQRFEVIEVDEDRGLVEIQYFDGDLDEVDLDEWYEQEIESIAAPEDWTGPMDDIEPDDPAYADRDEGWSPRSGASKRRRAVQQEEEGEEEEDEDEWGEGRGEEERWEDE